MKKRTKVLNQKGISMVALIITIILMLILAVLTVNVVLDGGLFNYARQAKLSSEKSEHNENIDNAFILAKGKSKNGKVTLEGLQNALNEIMGENMAEAIDNGDTIAVKIGDNYYVLDSKGDIIDTRKMEQVQYPGDITKGGGANGSSTRPYVIDCIEDLVAFSRLVNTSTASNGWRFTGKYVVLTKDLDFNSIFSYADYTAKYIYDSSKNAYVKDATSDKTIKELCTTGYGFICITNTGPSEEQSFQGIFDGQNHTISNIYMNNTQNTTTKGLFGRIRNATIKNLTVDGLLKGKVTGGSGIGAIAGGSNGTSYIINCVNKATVEGDNCITGGIIGSGSGCYIRRCHNEGTVKLTGTASYVAGGVCGNSGTVNKCYNIGKVIGNGPVIIYGVGVGTVVNSYNISDIGNENVGAVAGVGAWNTKNSYNIGQVTANPSKIAQYGGPARDKMWKR